MAQRSRRNIASSVRGLARSRRAGKSGANAESAPEEAPSGVSSENPVSPTAGTVASGSDQSSEDTQASEAETAAPVESGLENAGSVETARAAVHPGNAATDNHVFGEGAPDSGAPEDGAPGDGASREGAPGDGASGDGASGDGAEKPANQAPAKKAPARRSAAKRTSAKKGPAKKGLGKKSAAAASDAAPSNSAAPSDATPSDSATPSDGKSADGKGQGANAKSAAGRTATGKAGSAAANGRATNGRTANGKATSAGGATSGKAGAAVNGKTAAAFDDNTPTAELPAVADGGGPVKAIPEAAVGRMAVYLRVLSSMQEQGTATVSSEELSVSAGVNSAKLRKDLSYIGSYGTRGVGYEVEVLIGQIERTLGLNKQQRVAVAGIGNLGHALANYGGFPGRGFPVEALFDIDPDLIGVPVGGLPVSHLDDIPEVCAERAISIGVIATPPTAAQTVCDRLVAGGVQCILNFAPVVLQVPEHIEVRKVDLAVEMQILSFHVARRADGQVNGQAAGAQATGSASAVVPS